MESHSRHQCLVYKGSPAAQLPLLAAVIKQKMNDGYRCLYLNTRPMVAGLRSCLATIEVDVEKVIAAGCLILSSEPLPSQDDGFDAGLVLAKLETLLDETLKDGYKGLWATGDMTWELGSEKDFTKLLDYEHRLQKLFERRPEVEALCQYHEDTLPPEAATLATLVHPTLFVNEAHARVNPHYTPLFSMDAKMVAGA